MTIKQHGGVFGRNPTFNDVTIDNDLDVVGYINFNSDAKIRAFNGDLIIGTEDTALRFDDGDDAIFPVNVNTGSKRNNSVTIGASNAQIKDIYMGGNLIVSSGSGIDFSATAGTGTSELLDDYEEGTFTPEIADASSGGNTGSAALAEGYYTKVGRLVTIAISLIDIDTTGMTSGNNLYVRNLPFSQGAGVDHGSARVNAVTFSGSLSTYCTGTYALVADSVSGASFGYVTVGDCTSGSADIYMSFTYRV